MFKKLLSSLSIKSQSSDDASTLHEISQSLTRLKTMAKKTADSGIHRKGGLTLNDQSFREGRSRDRWFGNTSLHDVKIGEHGESMPSSGKFDEACRQLRR